MKVGRKLAWLARSWWWLAVFAYSLSLGLFAFWSFSLTDPNLVFTSWAPYWQAQTWLWQNIYANPILQARLYVLIVSVVIASYGFLIFIFQRHGEKQSDRTVTLSRQSRDQGLVGNFGTTSSTSSKDTRHPVPTQSGSEPSNSGSNDRFEMLGHVQHDKVRGHPHSFIYNKHFIIALAIILLPLLFSYNALSHDMFNYLFNAKMVVVYQTNPHIQVALDFAQDEWTRFMHNTHTPAPYWYGWTGISLIPFSLGVGKFTLSWWLFRLFSVLSWVGLWWSWRKWGQWRGQLVATNWMLAIALLPLVLIEIIANGHNDLWMMVPAILSLGMVLYRRLSWSTLLGSIALLVFSLSIKFATAVLIPLWLLIALSRFLTSNRRYAKPKINSTVSTDSRHSGFTYPEVSGDLESSKRGFNLLSWQLAPLTQFLIQLSPLFASILLFIPLLTTRSQQFLPWYLTWSLVWMPLFTWNFRQSLTDRPSIRFTSPRLNLFIVSFTKIWIAWLLALSFSALFRYVPWLLTGGEYTIDLLTQQNWILWGGGTVSLSLIILIDNFRKKLT